MEPLKEIRKRIDIPNRHDPPPSAPQGDGDSRPPELTDDRPKPDALRDIRDHSA